MTTREDEEELRHLTTGTGGEQPPGEVDAVEIEAGDPAGALARVREVLRPVLERSGSEWPSQDEWRQLLPDWFVAACVDDREVKDCILDKWSLRAWLYWFQPDQRKWRWWDAEPDAGRLRVLVLPSERPYLRGSLEWLLKVAAGS